MIIKGQTEPRIHANLFLKNHFKNFYRCIKLTSSRLFLEHSLSRSQKDHLKNSDKYLLIFSPEALLNQCHMDTLLMYNHNKIVYLFLQLKVNQKQTEREMGHPGQDYQNHMKSDKQQPDKGRSEGKIKKQNRITNLYNTIYGCLKGVKLPRKYVPYTHFKDASKSTKHFRILLTQIKYKKCGHQGAYTFGIG